MTNQNNTCNYLEGIISVTAAISAKKRQIFKVFIDKSKHEKRDRKITHFVSQLKNSNIQYSLVERAYIDSLADGNSHGGVLAQVGDYTYTELSVLLSNLQCGQYITMLDGVEDPFNFGYSIRNLYAFGCKGFIIPQRNWMSSANVVAKSSAGASELCEIAVAPDDDVLVKLLKENGVDIICSALSSTSTSLFDFKPQKPFILFIGGEKRGISKTIIENADKIVHIPYTNENAKYSLPTASCAAIFGSHLVSIK